MSYVINLDGKTAVVTGAARGNGLAIKNLLCQAGARVIAVDKEFPYQKKKKSYSNNKIFEIEADMLDVEFFSIMTMRLSELNISKIDILVNNAGMTIPNGISDYKHIDWSNTVELNMTLPFKLSQYITNKYMKSRGSIVNITSLASELGFPNNPAYIASKGGLKALTASLAYDLAPKEIRVNAVAPGYIKTNMTQGSWSDAALRLQRDDKIILDRWGEPEDVANAVLFLTSDLASYMTGQNIYVDGGWSVKGI